VAVEPLEDRRTRLQAGLNAWGQLRQEKPINSGGRRYTRDELHEGFFLREAIQVIVRRNRVRLIVVDLTQEEIVQWIK
jgi:hypothetical protein